MMTEAELAAKLAPLPSIWLAAEERMCLLKYAGLSQGAMIEVGTAFGGSACILVLGSDKQVISVDPFKEPLCDVDGYKITRAGTEEIVHRIIGPDRSRWFLWQMTSEEAADYYRLVLGAADQHRLEGFQLGLVFIDGNHDYDFVRQDVDLWLPLIMKGGYLILHDSANFKAFRAWL